MGCCVSSCRGQGAAVAGHIVVRWIVDLFRFLEAVEGRRLETLEITWMGVQGEALYVTLTRPVVRTAAAAADATEVATTPVVATKPAAGMGASVPLLPALGCWPREWPGTGAPSSSLVRFIAVGEILGKAKAKKNKRISCLALGCLV